MFAEQLHSAREPTLQNGCRHWHSRPGKPCTGDHIVAFAPLEYELLLTVVVFAVHAAKVHAKGQPPVFLACAVSSLVLAVYQIIQRSSSWAWLPSDLLGGHLFVVDSPETMGSTANSLLNPFGLESHPQPIADEAQSQGDVEPEGNTESQWGGGLEWHGGQELPPIALPRSLCSITGASPIASCDGVPVAAQIKYGAGMVTAIGFGSLFSDANMGQHWLVEPDEELLSRFAVLYELLQLAFDLPLK